MLFRLLYKTCSILSCFLLILLSCEKDKPTEQKPESFITWEKTIGGVEKDVATSVLNTTDGSYLVAGYTASFGAGEYDIFLIKLDTFGDTMWTKTIGGVNNDMCHSAVNTADGCYLIAGLSASFGDGSTDVYLAKLDTLGNTIWAKTYGGDFYDAAYSIIPVLDGGYVLIGNTYLNERNIDIYIIKINSIGDTIWTKNIGSENCEFCYAGASSSDGGYFFAGECWPKDGGTTDIYLAKLDSIGDTIWSRTYGWDGCENANTVISTPDGGCIIGGHTFSWIGERPYLFRIDSMGNTLWTQWPGGGECDEIKSIIKIGEDSYVVAGYTNSFGANGWQILFIKIDILGNIHALKTLGTVDGYEGANSAVQSIDGGFIFVGTQTLNSPADIYIVKTDPNGNL